MSGTPLSTRRHPAPAARKPQPREIPRLRVADVLGDAKEVRLRHNGEDYRLRITFRGKLLLTK